MVEICGTMGFILGIVVGLVSTIMVFFNLLELNANFIMLLALNLIAIPLVYLLSGILSGVILYLPYKWYMKLRKGTTLYFETNEMIEINQ